MSAPMSRRLTRDTRHRVIAGVCSGLARRFGISPTGVRLAFVVSCLLPGPQFIAYLVLWVIMPADDAPPRY
jgi:phage shock protein PspC (stress-responsive transcriptional regulator)